jgi:hypothetical protein
MAGHSRVPRVAGGPRVPRDPGRGRLISKALLLAPGSARAGSSSPVQADPTPRHDLSDRSGQAK